jgi:protein FAM50
MENIPKKRQRLSILSFSDEDDSSEPIKKFLKNPDSIKNISEDKIIEEIKKKYEKEQIIQNSEILELSFAYWDGTNVKHTLKVYRSCTVSEFLEKAQQVLKKDYPHLENSSNLMYVKENLIIPVDYTFHDLIIAKASGTKGLLFVLEEKEGYRKDIALTAKVLERKWYEKNKHIFPANKWKLYEPD